MNEEAVVSRHSHICPLQKTLDELKSAPYSLNYPDVRRITVDAVAVKTVVYTYENPDVCDDP
ncbi:MAG: hypothetical protein IIX05_02620, partial [Selenomonadaceae bacterium]|nr:hypothetical protein [Selenomonadaceae bacterium]